VTAYLQAYRHNRVTLDLKGLSTDVATTAQVAPTAGAVALLRFETERGYSILLRGRQCGGSYLPFAAAVMDAAGRKVGHIAQGGQALLRVNATQGALTVRWGQGPGESCQFTYSLADKGHCLRAADHAHDFRQVEALCVSGILLSAVSGPLDGGR